MRVYGSSPLYNYVELVFRSKRLFIASVIIATLIMGGVLALRSGNYTAQALILLSNGSSPTAGQQVDSSELNSVKYKMQMLNLLSKDPTFIHDAMREANLDRGMSGVDFDKFCKDVSKALTYTAGDNVLEISCRWPDKRAADIIKAFYSAYSLRVVDGETAQSLNTTRMLKKAVAEYTDKCQKIDKDVIAYNNAHKLTPSATFEQARQQYQSQLQYVTQQEMKLASTGSRLNEVQAKLKSTSKMIVTFAEREQQGQDSLVLQAAKLDLSKAQDIRDAFVAKGMTPSNPYLVRATEEVKRLQTKVDKISKTEAAAYAGPGKLSKTHDTINPTWQGLDGQRNDLELELRTEQGELANAHQQLATYKSTLDSVSGEQFKYKWLTEEQARDTAMRENLAQRLMLADLDEQKDRQFHMGQMDMRVPPESEPESSSTKTLAVFAAGPLLGLIIAFAFSLLAENMDHSLRTPMEVEKHLGKPVLAVLPHMNSKEALHRQGLELGGGPPSNPPSLPS